MTERSTAYLAYLAGLRAHGRAHALYLAACRGDFRAYKEFFVLVHQDPTLRELRTRWFDAARRELELEAAEGEARRWLEVS